MREGRSFRRLTVCRPWPSWQWFMHSAVLRPQIVLTDFSWFMFFPWTRWRILLLWPQSMTAGFSTPTVSSLSQNPVALKWVCCLFSPDVYGPYGWVPVGLLALSAAWPWVATGFSANIFIRPTSTELLTVMRLDGILPAFPAVLQVWRVKCGY